MCMHFSYLFSALVLELFPFFAEKLDSSNDQCHCPVPCQRTVYKASLSSALLAQLNLRRFVMGKELDGEKELKVTWRVVILFFALFFRFAGRLI